jgi:hypothetical protein
MLKSYRCFGMVPDQINYKITLISMELKRNIHFIEFVNIID